MGEERRKNCGHQLLLLLPLLLVPKKENKKKSGKKTILASRRIPYLYKGQGKYVHHKMRIIL